MTKVYEKKELWVSADNTPGVLARLTAPMAESGININSWCGYSMDNKSYFMFITDNNEKTKEMLKASGYNYEEKDVIVYETGNEVGAMFKASQQLTNAGINIDYNYATCCGTPGCQTWIVFNTSDNNKALSILG